jgi:hypothetical protein
MSDRDAAALASRPDLRINQRPQKKFRRRNVKARRVDTGVRARVATEP